MKKYFTIIFLCAALTRSFSAFGAISKTMTVGVGVEFFERPAPLVESDGPSPLTKADFLSHFEVAFAFDRYFELASIFDFSLAGAGTQLNDNKESTDVQRRYFLGNFVESARVGLPMFKNRLKIAFEGGGGIYLSRHSQTRLPEPRFVYGPLLVAGPVLNYSPLLYSKYHWSDLFLQVRLVYGHYFDLKSLDGTWGLTLGFGGSF